MTNILAIGTKVKYVSFDVFFTGTIHGCYVNGNKLFYSVFLDKEYETDVSLGLSGARIFLSVVVCHCDYVSELKE